MDQALSTGRPSAVSVAGWSAIGAGVLSLVGLLSVLPWPQLFRLDASPGNAIVFEPYLLAVLVGHYAILTAGGACGLLAGGALALVLRRQRLAAAAAVLVGSGAALMGSAAARRAVDVAAHSGRSTVELSALVWAGGGMVLIGALALTLALRRRAGRLLMVLGLGAPALVAAGLALFAVLGPDAYPEVWGVTFPPPPDYLLAIWFIVLGRKVHTGSLP